MERTKDGLLLLIIGSGLTSYLAIESQLVIEEGETRTYSESRQAVELVVINKSNSNEDRVTTIPESFLKENKTLKHDIFI